MAALRIRSTSAVLLLTCVASLVSASSQVASSHSLQSNSRTAAPSAATSSGLPRLVDIAKSTGIEFSHLSSPEAKYVVESMSGGVALIDCNRDGWPDIYFTNVPSVDIALTGKKARSALYRNNRDGTFTDVSDEAGVAVDQDGNAQANMGAALDDYNHTGRFSIAITHFNEQYTALFRNDGNMNFTDVSYASGIAQSTTSYVGWSDEFIDFDNDGWDDFFLVNGHVYPQVDSIGMDSKFREPKLLFLNQRDGKFQNISKQVGPAIQEL